jgi:AcrR family transcriptional regulator
MTVSGHSTTAELRKGRPRSSEADRAIVDAFRELLSERGFADVRLEHVASRAGVGKATLYRRWPSKEALAEQLLAELAAPHVSIVESGDTHSDLLAAVVNPMRALTDTPFGPVIRALLSQIAVNRSLRDVFTREVVGPRRAEIARVVQRGVERGVLRADANTDVATELLVGPVYFRVLLGGELSLDFANRIVDAYLSAFGTRMSDDELRWPLPSGFSD